MPSVMVKTDHPKVPKHRLSDIADLAVAIADENRHPAGHTDLNELIQKKRITLSYNRYGDGFCGMLEHRNGKFHIYSNADQVGPKASGRARFTIAHELGHYFIDEHRRCLIQGIGLHGSDIDYHPKNPVEQEANHFASNLLMPSDAVKSVAKYPSGLSTILTLQKRFQASITFSAVRYCDLEIEPVTIIRWSSKGYAWKRISPSFRQRRLRKTIESFEDVAAESATHQALSGNEPEATGFFQTTTVASQWFDFVDPGSPSDVMLLEGAMKLGEYGYITTLSEHPNQKFL